MDQKLGDMLKSGPKHICFGGITQVQTGLKIQPSHGQSFFVVIWGLLNMVGNFHFAPGKSFHQSNFNLIDLLSIQTESYNISHKINKLSFGDSIPGVVNPLDGIQWVQAKPNGVYQYFFKVVPTEYTSVRGHTIQSNQFSVTEHYKSSEEDHFRSLPGVFFFYDLSPIKDYTI